MVCGGLLRLEWKRWLMMAISIHNVMLWNTEVVLPLESEFS